MDFIRSMIAAFSSADAFWMWIIFSAQMVSVAIIIERVMALYVRRQPNQKNITKIITEDIRMGELDKALKKVENLSHNQPIAVVAQAGIQAAMNHGGKEEIQLKMDEILIEENARIERRIGFLAMFANVATLMGLLGTITGLIHSFAGIAAANPAEKAAILSRGIALAMNTTAYGLIVAVPALIMYSVLQNRAALLSEDLNKSALKIFIGLGFDVETLPTPKKKGTR